MPRGGGRCSLGVEGLRLDPAAAHVEDTVDGLLLERHVAPERQLAAQIGKARRAVARRVIDDLLQVSEAGLDLVQQCGPRAQLTGVVVAVGTKRVAAQTTIDRRREQRPNRREEPCFDHRVGGGVSSGRIDVRSRASIIVWATRSV